MSYADKLNRLVYIKFLISAAFSSLYPALPQIEIIIKEYLSALNLIESIAAIFTVRILIKSITLSVTISYIIHFIIFIGMYISILFSLYIGGKVISASVVSFMFIFSIWTMPLTEYSRRYEDDYIKDKKGLRVLRERRMSAGEIGGLFGSSLATLAVIAGLDVRTIAAIGVLPAAIGCIVAIIVIIRWGKLED